MKFQMMSILALVGIAPMIQADTTKGTFGTMKKNIQVRRATAANNRVKKSRTQLNVAQAKMKKPNGARTARTVKQ